MKRSKSTSGKAPVALSQPQPTAADTKQPTAEQIEKALTGLVQGEIEQFNCDLEIARRVYRSNPKLVTSKNYPEPWRTLAIEGGNFLGDRDTQKALSIEELRRQELPEARRIATLSANKTGSHDAELSPATNLLNEHGALEDPPTTTYLLLAQRFEDGKDLECLQDVELSYDENWKLRRYLAELRGLMPAKDAA
jgi:hypothetical protein